MNLPNVYYRVLLSLYPAEYREQFASEMAAVFDRTWPERRENAAAFLIRETAGAIGGAARQWLNPAPAPALACAQSDLPPEVLAAQQRTDALVERMVQAIATHRFEEARRCAREETEARETLRMVRAKWGLAD